MRLAISGKLSDPMTERELQILQLLAQGQSSTKIAKALGLSPSTIMWYRKRLHLKFDVHSTPELVVAATKQGLL